MPTNLLSEFFDEHHDLRLQEAFVLRVGRELHAHGASTHRLEPELTRLAERLGLEGQFLITPTSMLAAFGAPTEQRVHLVRVDQGDEDLGKLLELDEVAAAV
ncbi:MAG: threonine/serine exporter family protein, partial [Planctomycetota bacterium]